VATKKVVSFANTLMDQNMVESYVCESAKIHTAYRYSDASAAWVLVASILIFFMKAGFMLVEAAFVADRADRRSVILFVSSPISEHCIV
jgi:hypothetical protein